MKKMTKMWLIVAACFVLAGGAGFCFAMAENHWDFSLLGSRNMETVTREVTEEFRDIAIDADTEEIVFRPSEDGTCRVVCYESEKERHTVSVQNGTLSIQRVDTRAWYDHISLFSFASPTITVYLPRAEYGALSIEESTGDITIPQDFRFGSVNLRLSTGDVDCRASASGLMRIRTSTGDIRAEGLSAGEMDLSVSTGRVEALSLACEGSIAVSVSTGRARLMDVTCGSLTSAGNTGDIDLKNVLVKETISISRSTGDVSFDGCDAAELTIETSTGRVSGSLLTPKVFIARSDTGRVSVPETTTGGTCRITTDTGSIKVTVVDE